MRPQDLRTVNDVFLTAAGREPSRILLVHRSGTWRPVSARELYRRVAGVARALCAWGLRKGDRVAILSENRFEWAVADFACLALGLVDVPIYTTLTPEQTAYILRDSGARAIFVSNAEQAQKVRLIAPETALEQIVSMDEVAGLAWMEPLMRAAPEGRDPELDARAASIQSDDLATIVYTSGTTGQPKGVMLTHGNLASNLHYTLSPFALGGDDVYVSFLPLCHITARHVDYGMFLHGVTVAYCPRIDDLPMALREVRPTFFVSVPRLYEKTRNIVEARAASPLKRRVLRWALAVGRRHMADIVARRLPRSFAWKIADRLVFARVREGFGGRVQTFISGGAPLGRETAEWYASVGLPICEGYGLTETSPVVALNRPGAHKLGSVGKPLPNVEARIAADGEILVRGPSVFHGYWKLPEETAAALEQDGWFHTGDIGALDADGFLSVTDRKKDLLKTSGGKFIAPQPIECALMTNALVAQAVVIGDRRRFPAVLIAPHFPLLEDWARANDVRFGSRQKLVEDPRVVALYEGIVAGLNARLAQFEKLKKVLLVAEEFSIATGEMTPTLKLRRRVVEEKYRSQIKKLYAEAPQPAEEAVRS